MKITTKIPPQIQRLSRRWSFGKPTYPPIGLLPATVHPVVVIPGILGTWPPSAAPKGRLDPVSRSYTNLVEGLTRLGYRAGESLFAFPYDWRLNVSDLAEVLRAEISRIKRLKPHTRPGEAQVDYSRVDLVCHSMGGLVGRAYVQGDSYANDVARLFLVAAPMKGSLAAYYAYEGGDSTGIGIPIDGARSMVALSKARELRLHRRVPLVYRTLRGRDLPDLFQYMQSELHSIYDLLPLESQKYLYSLDEAGRETTYPYGYPRNEPLERLNQPAALDRLDRVEEIVCLYSSAIPTLARLQVTESQVKPMFVHGQLLSPQPEANRQPGDSIVGVFSAHLDLPPARSDGQPWRVRVRNEDVSVALGQRLDHVQIVADPHPVRYLLDNFTRPEVPALTAALWDGPALAARRPNFAALII